MPRALYAAIVKLPDQGDGYYRGIMAFVTHDVINVMTHAASLDTQSDLDNWGFLSMSDGGAVSELTIRLGGMIAGQKPLTRPFSNDLREQLADYRASLLGAMRNSDSREIVEIPNARQHSPEPDTMVDLSNGGVPPSPETPAEESAPRRSKRA